MHEWFEGRIMQKGSSSPMTHLTGAGQIREEMLGANLAADGIGRAHCLSPRTSL